MSRRLYLAALPLLGLLVAAVCAEAWSRTPYGRLDRLAAFSLRALTFETELQPDPAQDLRFRMPVNLLFPASMALPSESVARTQAFTVPRPDFELPVRAYWPEAAEAPALPVIVYFHGGGFVVGSVDIFDALARSLAQATGAVVVSVDYRLAPAHPYPTPLEDCAAALDWVVAQAEPLGVDATRVVLAGDSAGGQLAAALALRARDQGGPPIAAQLLYYPATDLSERRSESFERFIDGYGLSSEAGRAFEQAYVGQVEDKRQPYVSPLYAERLAGLPPALVVTAGFDPLRDEGRAYAQRLAAEGVAVQHLEYPEMIHGFMSVVFFSQRRAALEQTGAFLERQLGRAQ